MLNTVVDKESKTPQAM